MRIPINNTELDRERYPIAIFNDPYALQQVVNSFGDEGAELMNERSCTSSVPPFLGDLIKHVKNEVAPQIPLRREFVLARSPTGVVLAGGSSLLPTIELETAYRIFGYRFPTDWTAKYALAYSSGVAYAKKHGGASISYDKTKAKFRKQYFADLPLSPEERIIPYGEEDASKAYQESQQWASIAWQAREAVSYYGGLTFFMEVFAQNPTGFLSHISHSVIKRIYGYPSAGELEEIRKGVDCHFNNRDAVARAFMEAQRLQVPLQVILYRLEM